MSNNLGEVIRKARKEQGLSQELLAKKSGVSMSTIIYIECGRTTKPYIETLEKLAPCIKVELYELVQLMGKETSKSYNMVKSNNLGEAIRKARKEQGLSKKRLAEESGISTVAITKIENGRTKKPHIETLKQLAPCIKVELDELIQSMQSKGNSKSCENADVKSVNECDNIRDFIKYIRNKNKITIYELTKKTNVSKELLHEIEQGAECPEDELINICTYLDKIVPGVYKKFVYDKICNDQDKSFGSFIQKARINKKLTKTQMIKAGIIKIEKIEGKKIIPNMKTLLKLVKILNLDYKELLQLAKNEVEKSRRNKHA